MASSFQLSFTNYHLPFIYQSASGNLANVIILGNVKCELIIEAGGDSC